MVVGLILEHEDPVGFLAVNVRLDLDGAGVDLLALIEILQNAALLEDPRAHRCQIHQRQGLVLTSELCAVGKVLVIGAANVIGRDIDVFDIRQEGRMTAVIAPVGVDHADLGDGGVALLGITEVILTELDVVIVHRQTEFLDEGIQTRFVQADKALQRLHGGGDVVVRVKGIVGVQRRLAGLHGVDEILLDRLELLIRQVAGNDVDPRIFDAAALLLGEQGNALLAGIRPLVELTGQILHGKHPVAGVEHREGVVHLIDSRLGEHSRHSRIEILLGQAVGIVAVEDAHADDIQPQCGAQITENGLRFDSVGRLLFDINTKNRHGLISFVIRFAPHVGHVPLYCITF